MQTQFVMVRSLEFFFYMLSQLEFMRGLVQLVVEKLHAELPHLQCDDTLFSHTVDETLGFDRELRESFGYPSSQPSVISVLTQAQIFLKWISMEKKCESCLTSFCTREAIKIHTSDFNFDIHQ